MRLKMGKKWRIRDQKGFTLVNVAGLVVSAGIAMGVAVQGSGFVDHVKNENFYSDLKTMEDRIWTYKEAKGSWPGDCDKDGIIGYQPQNRLETDTLAQLNSRSTSGSCAVAANEDLNAPFADMRRVGFASDEENNLVFSEHSQGGFFQIGHLVEGRKQHNAIVAYNVPAEVAQWIDEKIDGIADTTQGRIRRLDGQADQWVSKGQGSVTLAYYFERKI